jgi:hypothetical protein
MRYIFNFFVSIQSLRFQGPQTPDVFKNLIIRDILSLNITAVTQCALKFVPCLLSQR